MADESAVTLRLVSDGQYVVENRDGFVVPGQDTLIPVGSVDLKPPSEDWGVAELGVVIARDHWNEGYATAGIDLMCEYAFQERRLEKVYASVYASNAAASRVLEKVGFTEEGLLREEGFADGERVDLHRYGLLADEWRRG